MTDDSNDTRYRALAMAALDGKHGYLAGQLALGDRGAIAWLVGGLHHDAKRAGIALPDERKHAIVEECMAAKAQQEGHTRWHLVELLTYVHREGTDHSVHATPRGAYHAMAQVMRECLSEMRSQYVTDLNEERDGESVGERLEAIERALAMEASTTILDRSARDDLDNASEHWRQITQYGEEFFIETMTVLP